MLSEIATAVISLLSGVRPLGSSMTDVPSIYHQVSLIVVVFVISVLSGDVELRPSFCGLLCLEPSVSCDGLASLQCLVAAFPNPNLG